jgi:hypothetical protein
MASVRELTPPVRRRALGVKEVSNTLFIDCQCCSARGTEAADEASAWISKSDPSRLPTGILERVSLELSPPVDAVF